jgi:hypothetical protein
MSRSVLPKVIAAAWPLALVVLLAAIGSVVFGIPMWRAALIVLVLFVAGWIVTEGEYMPGQADNPEGKELHPYWLLLGLLAAISVLSALGYVIPSVREFRL